MPPRTRPLPPDFSPDRHPQYFIHTIETEQDLEWLQNLAARLLRRRHRERPEGAPMNEQELCAYLDVSREAVRKMRAHPVDPLPALKVGRRWLYKQEDVERWA